MCTGPKRVLPLVLQHLHGAGTPLHVTVSPDNQLLAVVVVQRPEPKEATAIRDGVSLHSLEVWDVGSGQSLASTAPSTEPFLALTFLDRMGERI